MTPTASLQAPSHCQSGQSHSQQAFEAPLPLGVDEAFAFLRHQWEARRHTAKTLVVHLPAPTALPEALLGESPNEGFLWDAPTGPSFAGLGTTHSLEVRGPGRPAALRLQAELLFRRLESVDHPAANGPEPRLFGGLAFQCGGAEEAPWKEFGDGSFTLPRWLYARAHGPESGATLSLALRCDEEAVDHQVKEELETILTRLATRHARSPQAASNRIRSFGGDADGRIRQMPREAWAEQVEAIRAAIQKGAFRKIVAARRATVELDESLDPVALLERLRPHQGSGCRRFAFFRAHAAFLGSTPERLILRRGRTIETEALAGSIGSGRQQAARLLDSRKDQGEHALVVEHIVERLGPVCDNLEWSDQPRVRELRDLLHLHTPIHGHLSRDLHVLELVERLHPTPAVGGVPAAAAVRWISEGESHPRGWYSGAIGWFNAAGDGEFDVALRSCLLTGSTALLYAGAGIMLDSDPDLEYQETDLKQRSLLAALGVDG